MFVSGSSGVWSAGSSSDVSDSCLRDSFLLSKEWLDMTVKHREIPSEWPTELPRRDAKCDWHTATSKPSVCT